MRTIVSLILVAAITATSIAWLALWNPLEPHRPDYQEAPAAGRALPALVPKVLFVVVDGLRYDVSERTPCLQALRQRGASARSMAGLPSVSQPMWTALVSGALPEITDSGLMNVDDGRIPFIRVDQIFAAARRAGLTTALSASGGRWWRSLIPPQGLDRTFFVNPWDAAADRAAAEGALPFVQDPAVNLVMVYFADYDEMSHAHGALSPEALQSAAAIDENVCLLVDAADASRTVVIVTSDHGEIDAGGHGGAEPAVLETPFVMAGPRVLAGQSPPIRDVDIAPAIAALIGAELPRSGQGRIPYEMLDVTAEEQARGEAALVAQQLAFAQAYARAIGAAPVPGEIAAQAQAIDSPLAAGNYSEADRLARGAQAALADYLARERGYALTRARLLALLPALLALAVLGYALVANWRAGARLPLMLAVVGMVLFHLTFLARVHTYSLSAMTGVGYLGITIGIGAMQALVSSVLTVALARLALTRWLLGVSGANRRPFTADLAALALGLTALPFLVALLANALNGSLGSWNLIEPLWHFLLIFGLVQSVVMGLAALAVTGVYATAAAIARRGRGV